jgi:hypothetical protein
MFEKTKAAMVEFDAYRDRLRAMARDARTWEDIQTWRQETERVEFPVLHAYYEDVKAAGQPIELSHALAMTVGDIKRVIRHREKNA